MYFFYLLFKLSLSFSNNYYNIEVSGKVEIVLAWFLSLAWVGSISPAPPVALGLLGSGLAKMINNK